jgi:hypothetical protein
MHGELVERRRWISERPAAHPWHCRSRGQRLASYIGYSM